MSVRSRMTHRAAVQRQVQSGFDGFGLPETTLTNVYSGESLLPCYVQARQERSVSTDGRLFVATNYTMWAPLDADLLEEDAVTMVGNRRGQEVFGGKLEVSTLIRRESHLEATLERFG